MGSAFVFFLNQNIRLFVVIGAVLLVRGIFALLKMPRKYCYILWLLVFVRMLLPVTIESSFGIIPESFMQIGADITSSGSGAVSLPITAPQPNSPDMSDAPPVQGGNDSVVPTAPAFSVGDTDAAGAGGTANGAPGVTGDTAAGTNGATAGAGASAAAAGANAATGGAGASAAAGTDGATAGAGANAAAAGTNGASAATDVLAVIWFAGAVGLLIYNVICYARLRYRLRCCVKLEERVFLSDRIEMPFVFGFWRPCAYLPDTLDAKSRAYVLAHEKEHIRRKDATVKILCRILACVYWFNPLVWIVVYMMEQDMEQACDDAAVLAMDGEDKKRYAELLVRMGAAATERGAILNFGAKNIKTRIRNVMSEKKARRWTIAAAVAAALTVIAVLTVTLLTNPKSPHEVEAADSDTHENTQETPGSDAHKPDSDVTNPSNPGPVIENNPDMSGFWSGVVEADPDSYSNVWSDMELHGYGMLYYPGFELTAVRDKDKNNVFAVLDDGEIRITNPSNTCLIITKGEKQLQINTLVALFDKTFSQFGGVYYADPGERVHYADLTGDGKDELIIKMTVTDTGSRYNDVYVVDTDTLTLIKLPGEKEIQASLGDYVKQNYKTEVTTDWGTVQYTVWDGSGNVCEGNCYPDDGREITAAVPPLSYIYFKDGRLYYKNGVWMAYAGNAAFLTCVKNVCAIETPFAYDSESHSFKLMAGESVIMKPLFWKLSDYAPIDKNLLDKAEAVFTEWSAAAAHENALKNMMERLKELCPDFEVTYEEKEDGEPVLYFYNEKNKLEVISAYNDITVKYKDKTYNFENYMPAFLSPTGDYTSMHLYDITGDGTDELIMGKGYGGVPAPPPEYTVINLGTSKIYRLGEDIDKEPLVGTLDGFLRYEPVKFFTEYSDSLGKDLCYVLGKFTDQNGMEFYVKNMCSENGAADDLNKVTFSYNMNNIRPSCNGDGMITADVPVHVMTPGGEYDYLNFITAWVKADILYNSEKDCFEYGGVLGVTYNNLVSEEEAAEIL